MDWFIKMINVHPYITFNLNPSGSSSFNSFIFDHGLVQIDRLNCFSFFLLYQEEVQKDHYRTRLSHSN